MHEENIYQAIISLNFAQHAFHKSCCFELVVSRAIKFGGLKYWPNVSNRNMAHTFDKLLQNEHIRDDRF
jgi:hypothetical protein